MPEDIEGTYIVVRATQEAGMPASIGPHGIKLKRERRPGEGEMKQTPTAGKGGGDTKKTPKSGTEHLFHFLRKARGDSAQTQDRELLREEKLHRQHETMVWELNLW